MPATPFVGQIMPAGFGIVPKGWAACNGALLSIAQNTALFTLLGVNYGGNGTTTFGLPDLRGRAVLGSNIGSVPWGLVSGTENVTLNAQQLPLHNHMLQATTTAGGGRGAASPTANLFGTNNSPANMIFVTPGGTEIPLAPGTNIALNGGNQFHNNMQPFLVINYVIATQGLFPSRP